MIVPDPTDQFDGQQFTGLYFSINSSSLDVAVINSTTGRHSRCYIKSKEDFEEEP